MRNAWRAITGVLRELKMAGHNASSVGAAKERCALRDSIWQRQIRAFFVKCSINGSGCGSGNHESCAR